MTQGDALDPALFESSNLALISSSDVATLAQVHRPVISMWKKRYLDSEFPFPSVVMRQDQTDYFDCHEVAAWFAETNLGNNPDAVKDALTFTNFHMLTAGTVSPDLIEALLLLRSLIGEPLVDNRDQLISDADDWDPDDLFLFNEVNEFAELPDHRAAVIVLVNEIFARSFSTSRALDQLALRSREASIAARGRSVTAPLTEFSAQLLLSLVESSGADTSELRFLDLDPAHFGLVSQLLANESYLGIRPELLQNYPLVRGNGKDTEARQTHRLHVAHGLDPLTYQSFDAIPSMNTASFAFISPSSTAGLRSAILEEHLPDLTDASPHHVGVIVGPQELLTGANSQADGIRSPLIRAGHLRCIILLPAGLFPNHPREQLAMWVLATPNDRPAPTSKFYLADLSGVNFETAATDLLTDCVSATQNSKNRAFAFLQASSIQQVVRTPGIVFPTTRKTVALDAIGDKVLFEQVLQEHLKRFDLPQLLATPILLHAPHQSRLTLQEAQSNRLVAVVAGNRIETEWLVQARPQDLGTRVITKEILIRLAGSAFGDPAAAASPVITPLALGQLDQIRVTRPGDVVFVQHDKTQAAWFDSNGGNVVAHPLRVVRSRSAQVNGRVLAQDLNGFQKFPNAWQQWEFRTFPDRLAADATAALEQLGLQRAKLLEHLSAIEEVEQAVATAVSRGGVHVRVSK